MYIRSFTLLFSSFFLLPQVHAANQDKNPDHSCSQANNTLQAGSYLLTTDCADSNFCGSDGKCTPKGCRKDEFPIGYPQGAKLPDKCKSDEFCPDEGDACQKLLPVGSACQLNRDDECEPPPNFKELADPSFNHNGSVCLNFQCMWANVTAGQECVLEQMPYIAYAPANDEFIYVVSRGNCRSGLFCDATKSPNICAQKKQLNEQCTADKECLSNNCTPDLQCGDPASAPKHFGTWVYLVVGLGIITGMVGTLFGLWLLHRKNREEEREKRTQYWREQNAFRQNILQMRDTAKASLLSLSLHGDTPRSSTIYNGREHTSTEDSAIPMLRRSSGQRNAHASDDDGTDSIIHGETPITLPADQENKGWAGRHQPAITGRRF